MNKKIVMLGLVSLMTGLSACTRSSRTVTPGVPPELKHSWEVSFNRGDAAGVAALYAPDAQLLMSATAPIRGADNIRRTVEGMIKEGLKVKIDDEENVGSGDLAYVFGHYRVLKGEGGPAIEHGGFVEVWQRREGVWAIHLDINASGAPAQSD
jgi:uncharacterized protein (TIGR02246 family)